jgi:hypothetical protein
LFASLLLLMAAATKKEKKRRRKAGASSGHITSLKQSILETFDIYDVCSFYVYTTISVLKLHA